MNDGEYNQQLKDLEKKNRILKKKLERSIANRALLEEILETHSNALKVRNKELEESRELLQNSETRYRFLAHYDELTQLQNRTYFNEEMFRAISRVRECRTMLALIFIDLDRFKDVNDTFGHRAGDELLNQSAKRLNTVIRPTDVIARIGGDEFAIIIESFTDRNAVEIVCRRILSVMAEPFSVEGASCKIGASIGISIYPDDADDPDGLFQKADAAMYAVKKSGANNFMFYQKMEKTEDCSLPGMEKS